ncbi:MAG: transporter [bacterium]
MDKIKIVAMSFLIILLAGPGFSQSRFRDTINFEDNEFISMGNIEISHRYQKFSGADPDTYDMTVLEYQLTYGVMTNFEVGLNIPIAFQKKGEQDEVGDIIVSQRFKFTEEPESAFDLSGGLELILPTGDEDILIGSDDLDARFHLTFGQSLAEDWRWLSHLGYRFYGEEENDDLFEYDFAFSNQFSSDFKTVIELNGHSGGVPDQSEIYISPGFIFQPRDGFSVAVSAPIGVSSDAYDHKANFQFNIEF